MAETEKPPKRDAEREAEPTAEFGDPERFAIRVWMREARGKRIFVRARIECGVASLGRPRDLVKLKDFAETLDDARYRIDFCLRESLPKSVLENVGDDNVSADAIDEVWRLANEESDETPVPELAERFLWIEGLEAFDGFRSIFFVDGDDVVLAWREVRKSEVHVRRIPREEYEHVVDDFLDWFEETARYHLRPPLWFRRYSPEN